MHSQSPLSFMPYAIDTVINAYHTTRAGVFNSHRCHQLSLVLSNFIVNRTNSSRQQCGRSAACWCTAVMGAMQGDNGILWTGVVSRYRGTNRKV